MKHARFLIPPLLMLTVAACGGGFFGESNNVRAPGPGEIRPKPRPGGVDVLGAGAVTAEQFDTTTEAERLAATAGATGVEAGLGRTIATLGNPADPGFWLETPLVDRIRPGRVVSVANGEAVQLELRPIGGDPGAGSRISLPALRLLGVGLTGLHELEVFAR